MYLYGLLNFICMDPHWF